MPVVATVCYGPTSAHANDAEATRPVTSRLMPAPQFANPEPPRSPEPGQPPHRLSSASRVSDQHQRNRAWEMPGPSDPTGAKPDDAPQLAHAEHRYSISWPVIFDSDPNGVWFPDAAPRRPVKEATQQGTIYLFRPGIMRAMSAWQSRGVQGREAAPRLPVGKEGAPEPVGLGRLFFWGGGFQLGSADRACSKAG